MKKKDVYRRRRIATEPARKSRAVEVVALLSNPKIWPYCLNLPSKVSYRPRIYLCTKLHPCVPETAWLVPDCASPKRLCFHPNSNWSIPAQTQKTLVILLSNAPKIPLPPPKKKHSVSLLNPDLWPKHNKRVRLKSIRLWFWVSDSPNPKCSNCSPHRRLLTCARPEEV